MKASHQKKELEQIAATCEAWLEGLFQECMSAEWKHYRETGGQNPPNEEYERDVIPKVSVIENPDEEDEENVWILRFGERHGGEFDYNTVEARELTKEDMENWFDREYLERVREINSKDA